MSCGQEGEQCRRHGDVKRLDPPLHRNRERFVAEPGDRRTDPFALVAQDEDDPPAHLQAVDIRFGVRREGIDLGVPGQSCQRCLKRLAVEDGDLEERPGTCLNHQRRDLRTAVGRQDDTVDLPRGRRTDDHPQVLRVLHPIKGKQSESVAECRFDLVALAVVGSDDIDRHPLILLGILGDAGELLFCMRLYFDTALVGQRSDLADHPLVAVALREVQLMDLNRLIVEDLKDDVSSVQGNNGIEKGFFV